MHGKVYIEIDWPVAPRAWEVNLHLASGGVGGLLDREKDELEDMAKDERQVAVDDIQHEHVQGTRKTANCHSCPCTDIFCSGSCILPVADGIFSSLDIMCFVVLTAHRY